MIGTPVISRDIIKFSYNILLPIYLQFAISHGIMGIIIIFMEVFDHYV